MARPKIAPEERRKRRVLYLTDLEWGVLQAARQLWDRGRTANTVVRLAMEDLAATEKKLKITNKKD